MRTALLSYDSQTEPASLLRGLEAAHSSTGTVSTRERGLRLCRKEGGGGRCGSRGGDGRGVGRGEGVEETSIVRRKKPTYLRLLRWQGCHVPHYGAARLSSTGDPRRADTWLNQH